MEVRDTVKPARPVTARETKTALLEAAHAAVVDTRPRGSTRAGDWSPRRGVRAGVRWFVVVLTIAGGALLVLQPEWLAGAKLPRETPEVRVASATLTLVEAMGRVQAYKADNGRLPNDLPAAGVTNERIRYQREEGETVVVSLQAGDSLVRLRSTDSLRPLVAQAIRVLERR